MSDVEPFRVGDIVRLVGSGFSDYLGQNYIDSRFIVEVVDGDGEAYVVIDDASTFVDPDPGGEWAAQLKFRPHHPKGA